MNMVKKSHSFIIMFKNMVDKGMLLFLAMIIGMLVANSPYSSQYYSFMSSYIKLGINDQLFYISVHHFINDFLMAIFFLLVGLEIKREFLKGNLSKPSDRVLPIICAIGGVIAPVLVYKMFVFPDPIGMRGWAIPAATDIAFALGVLALIGRGLPIVLRVFLTALAIIDDLIAVIIIAVFYTDNLNLLMLLFIALLCIVLFAMNRMKVTNLKLYLMVGLAQWFLFYASGVHATLSGVLLSMFVPLQVENKSPLEKLEKKIHPLSAFIIIPIFAFANSGINLSVLNIETMSHAIFLGITMGLFFGKQLGIFTTLYVCTRLGIAKLPDKTNYLQFYGVSMLCGIGFTMSLFIALLAFEGHTMQLNEAKLGVLCGSIISAIGAFIIFKTDKKLRST